MNKGVCNSRVISHVVVGALSPGINAAVGFNLKHMGGEKTCVNGGKETKKNGRRRIRLFPAETAKVIPVPSDVSDSGQPGGGGAKPEESGYDEERWDCQATPDANNTIRGYTRKGP